MKEKIKAILQSFVKPFDIGIGLPYWHVIEADKINEISEEISKALPQLYSIKPLEWEEVGSIHRSNLNSGLCYYEIERTKDGKRKLKIYEDPDDYYSFVYTSIGEAKAKAQEDWNNRISQYLTEYKEGEVRC